MTTGIIPGAGHFAPEEAPDEVWQAIGRFVTGGVSPNATASA